MAALRVGHEAAIRTHQRHARDRDVAAHVLADRGLSRRPVARAFVQAAHAVPGRSVLPIPFLGADVPGFAGESRRAHDALKTALASLNYRNLDELPEFKNVNTTTEFLAKHLFDRLAETARADGLGRAGRDVKSIRVTLSESHVARAWYEANLW